MAQDTMRELSNSCCIVGAAESDEMGVLPHKSQMALHLESISNACADAGLKVSDVDGIFTAGAHSPALIAEALGVTPRYVDGTSVGGCSFIIMVEHAIAALHHHLCDVAVITHGESGRSQVGVTRVRDTSIAGCYEIPYGFGAPPTWFGLITTRHMHEYGTTLEQLAEIAVSARYNAALNPEAFVRGVAASAGDGGLTNHLFGVRTQGLFGTLSAAQAPSYLSGLLIGHELHGLLPARPMAVHLIGEVALLRRYQRALAASNVTSCVHGETLVTRGLFRLAASIR